MINSDEEARKRQEAEAAVSSILGELSSVEQHMQRTYELLATGAATDFVSGKLRELENRQKDLNSRLSEKREELQSLASRVANFYESKEDVRAFVERLQGPGAFELYKLRAQIASRLRTLVESLVVAPLGDRPKTERGIDFLRGQPGATDVIHEMEARLAGGAEDARYFAVGFRNGAVRAVFPRDGDALDYRQQVIANAGGVRLETSELATEALEFFNLLGAVA